MKLQIKETGEIVELIGYFKRKSGKPDFTIDSYETLDELCKAVEDYEEPKETALEEMIRKLESDFEKYPEEWNNLEEAKKAVEKLKAWERLKDKGFRFTGFSGGSTFIKFTFDKPGEPCSAYKDLDLLFGGEE